MKVIIITEGGRRIGFGHITRCLSLYQAFEEMKIAPGFIVSGDDSVLDLLKGKDCRIFDWLREKEKLLALIKGADVIIIDSYLANKTLYNKISEAICGAGILIMIDDYKRIEYPDGIIINPSIYGDRMDYPKKKESIYLLGKDYIILRPEFRTSAIPIKVINKEIKKVLVTFGGMNHVDLIHKIMDYLKSRFDFTFDCVDYRERRVNSKEMLELMLKADLCISGGGQTVHELARVGVPTIGICLSENQRMNIEAWQEKGFIKYIGWSNDANLLKNLELAVEKLSSDKLRTKMSMIGRKFIDGLGTSRIVKEILFYKSI